MTSELSIRLKNLRQQRHLKQSEIADLLGITQVAYGRFELGSKIPKEKYIKILSDFYKIDPLYLVGPDKFKTELERRYDDIINLSFMNSNFSGFCIVIEEIALNSLRVALGKKIHNEIIEDYSSGGYKRQEYLSNFKEKIDNKSIKAIEIPNLKETILEKEQQIALQYFK
ncbi:helix-turn-helix domain-containing protein [Lactococcus garvieae]|uniref:helix-turn-helix domain-containing protein n=1 Tax=Lactococcus garvieae TaxID=1363 RepID=UPI00308A9CC0|nr:hypothetical protein LG21E12_01870 [Lactococcus garvieae]